MDGYMNESKWLHCQLHDFKITQLSGHILRLTTLPGELTCLGSWSAQPSSRCFFPLIYSNSWVSVTPLVSPGPWLLPLGNVSFSCSLRKRVLAKQLQMKDFPRHNESPFPPSNLCFKSFVRAHGCIYYIEATVSPIWLLHQEKRLFLAIAFCKFLSHT